MATAYTYEVSEASTPVFETTLQDYDQLPVPLSGLTSLVITLRDVATGTLIRTNQNALNANGCTFHATTGLFRWFVAEADTTIINTTTLPIGAVETHEATFEATWGRAGGTVGRNTWTVSLLIANRRDIT